MASPLHQPPGPHPLNGTAIKKRTIFFAASLSGSGGLTPWTKKYSNTNLALQSYHDVLSLILQEIYVDIKVSENSIERNYKLV